MFEHPEALDYDLMTMTGRTLSEFADMGAAGAVALVHFIKYLGPGSALWRESNSGNEIPEWSTTAKTNAILADIFDSLSALRSEHAAKGSKKKPHKVKPYPRPKAGARKGVEDGVRVGDFEDWWKSGE